MIDWADIPASGVVPDANGLGRYQCYTTYKNRVFTNQIVFGKKQLRYVYRCGPSEFFNTIGKCLYDSNTPRTALSGIAANRRLKQILRELKRSRSHCVIWLSAYVYQNNRQLLFRKFEEVKT